MAYNGKQYILADGCRPASGLYGKSCRLVFDDSKERKRRRMPSPSSRPRSSSGPTQPVSLTTSLSGWTRLCPQRRQGRVLGSFWQKVHDYLSSNREDPPHGRANWKLGVKGGKLHLIFDQKTHTFFSVRLHPTKDTFMVEPDSNNLTWYSVPVEVAKSWISEAVTSVR